MKTFHYIFKLLKKLRHLEEELTSDEPCENSEARPETVMRQRQERENIKSKIRAVEREGDSVLEELKRVDFCCNLAYMFAFDLSFVVLDKCNMSFSK